MSRVMTAPAQRICQFQLAPRYSRRYWVLQLEYETQLAYSRQTRSFCWHLIAVCVHWNGSSPYPYNRSITAYLPITVTTKSVYVIWSTSVTI
jgi:hypothetical protein